ncbi:NADH-quinone oxidoreductase subunit NuoN [Aurantimonas sp. Leaf443]|uniref:NADH-quinone oxidoreductase subunit NuoN n=1 Tax=Aurantimonas sp. Leaf443 TaxID=1736378 RepID=UPI0006F3015E|nr:NADH-quinone oxidoreductase subunit NuoN [Aurantimonas sp. Leaf443]KQT82743.1 NADH:ubiquinone oxidoreductase subunit N [Aurantimonas sp. Leaf443]
MPSAMMASSLPIVGPELIMAVGAMILLMIGVFRGERSAGLVTALAVGLVVFTAFWLVAFAPRGAAFGGSFLLDPFAAYAKVLVLIGSALALVMSFGFAEREAFNRFEFPVLIVLSTLGMMVMVSAGDLIALYLGLELQSLAIYVLAAINRDSLRSTEAGLKYFVLGALSSGMLLYGASMVYGFTGQIEFPAIAAAAAQEGRSLGLIVGIVFVLSGLAFKISAVPFHMWTPDVYEGAPTPITAFMAGAPKVAAMALIARFTVQGFQPLAADWQQVLIFVSIASMIFGAFAAIGQRNIKRLMAYSSISHMGYALVGLSAANLSCVRGVLLYMTVYLAMTIGTFAVIMAMRRKSGQVETMDDLAGLSKSSPLLAICLTVMMLSLAGLPPLAGFFAKYFVFMAAVEAGLYPLAVIGVLASVVGLFYYLRLVKLMWFDEPAEAFLPMGGALKFALAVTALFVFPAYLVLGGPIFVAAEAAARTFF